MFAKVASVAVRWMRTLPGQHALISTLLAGLTFSVSAQENLLQNPGFEEAPAGTDRLVHWITRSESEGQVTVSDQGTHSGRQCVLVPANTAVEQGVRHAQAGAYLARCWVKSEAAQPVTLIVEDPDRPWMAYTCAEIKVPQNRWVQIETFCALDQDGPLTLVVGGMSSEFRKYHGTEGALKSSILVDDCELVRFAPSRAEAPAIWDAARELAAFDGSARTPQAAVKDPAHVFSGTAMFQDRQLGGLVRTKDGALLIDSLQGALPQPRGALMPTPPFEGATCALVRTNDRTGLHVTDGKGKRAYTAWLAANGVIDIEAEQVAQFTIQDCKLRYGLLPSFIGTDICYAPEKLASSDEVKLPSTQWFVGLGDGRDSMFVAVWGSDTQAASLHLSGAGKNRMIDQFVVATDQAGFSFSFVEHAHLWHEEALNEDWLGEYVPIKWERPFPARWMASFFVTAGPKPSFRTPFMTYAFPMANAKTRQWGVWFEDWNHYPAFFDDVRPVLHFEKTFIPNGAALIYFLEPAAADLFSPCDMVKQVLGESRAQALFDLDGNGLRKLKYSTPDAFVYDRPVCATTTHLSQIKKEEKPTVGVNLATHLFEFIREIRGRIDQYSAFFAEMKAYLDNEQKTHPEARTYIARLEPLLVEAQSKASEVYATPLPAVEQKIDAMKKLLREGQGDGFDCGSLDVRSPAGTQDDLCRRYNRLVIRFCETAALQTGSSAENALIAKHVWDASRQVLRQPTRWEPRRTLYFFEP